MLFSKAFGLNQSQSQLDFVDVDAEQDIPLFFDPYVFATDPDPFCSACHAEIDSFFQQVLMSVRAGDRARGLELLREFQEPNEICFGLSEGAPSGRGIGAFQSERIYTEIENSQAARTGLLSDLAECELFVDGIGPDKISDITANIIRGRLVKYTQDQCRLHGINMREVALGPTWDGGASRWIRQMAELPVIGEKAIILVPKKVVRWKNQLSLDKQQYYRNFVLEFYRDYNLDNNTSLVRLLKNGDRVVRVKDLVEQNPMSKDFLARFSTQNPGVFKKFKEAAQKKGTKPADLKKDEIDEILFVQAIKDELKSIPSGNSAANQFHTLMVGTLEYIFFPNLSYPKKEEDIHQGRKRIDILYTNSAVLGIFSRLRNAPGKVSTFVPVECKNYSNDPANPELDQIAGRFSQTRGWVGILVARKFADRTLFINRCRDTAMEQRGFIIPLVDEDICVLLDFAARGLRSEIDGYMDRVLREISA